MTQLKEFIRLTKPPPSSQRTRTEGQKKLPLRFSSLARRACLSLDFLGLDHFLQNMTATHGHDVPWPTPLEWMLPIGGRRSEMSQRILRSASPWIVALPATILAQALVALDRSAIPSADSTH